MSGSPDGQQYYGSPELQSPFEHSLENIRPQEITDEDRRRAALTVCANSADREEAEDVLAMLGLI
ncbi:hypothetical protein [Rhodococcus sp. 11-3]|uniref:hypothetical protein n=1 Tax=Rhodococcus sp. 11-3 TaxID=2854796 RepID=UPI0020401566|nr:hypothetical protein [Rhodococcus sp. 11-3]USC16976.1 hypothetical protein KZJ41_08975 [Rhodococcus sp. 11-3]